MVAIPIGLHWSISIIPPDRGRCRLLSWKTSRALPRPMAITAIMPWAVSTELEWKGFGLARGVDGALYSVFGPGQAVALAPLVAVARQYVGAEALHVYLKGAG